MTDFSNISAKEKDSMMRIFAQWIDWFIGENKIDETQGIYEDGGKTYTVADYVREVKKAFAFQSACKEYLSGAVVEGGIEAALNVMSASAPLVFGSLRNKEVL